uniref:Uncharacterized protein n=1 Tax=Parascaris equorum TaxID=6256 RepID=A0A914RNE7_PAREQ
MCNTKDTILAKKRNIRSWQKLSDDHCPSTADNRRYPFFHSKFCQQFTILLHCVNEQENDNSCAKQRVYKTDLIENVEKLFQRFPPITTNP